jgi:AcrR family transcriptional regulator
MTARRIGAGQAPARDQTRARILAVARDLFGSDGFDSTTVRSIAKRVGISDPALYHYFSSKREILNAAWELPLGGGIASMRPTGTLTRDRLDEIVEASIRFAADNDNFLRLIYREILSGDQTALALRQQNRSILRRTLFEHIRTIADDGEADVRTEAVLALLTGSTMKAQIEQGANFPKFANTPGFRQRIQCWAAELALPAPEHRA